MLQIIENKEFSKLPDGMRQVAEEALETMLHTGDGQLCDIMIDKAALEAIYKAGKASGETVIENYADTTVAIADIKMGTAEATAWGCDLTYDYVKINADYRS